MSDNAPHSICTDEAGHLPADASQKRSMAGSDDVASANASCIDSDSLLRGRNTVEILHNGSTYRLHATRLGKLILTK